MLSSLSCASIAWCCSSSGWVRCNAENRRCEVPKVLRFTHPSHQICIKVNASSRFGDATSNETCVYLHDVSKCIALLCTSAIYCSWQIAVLLTKVTCNASYFIYFIYFNSVAGSKPMEYNDKEPSYICT